MNKILGYSLISIGITAFVFIVVFRETEISYKAAWFVFSILLIIGGSYFFAKYKIQQLNNQDGENSSRLAEIIQLKLSGDKIKITLDNAEIKSRNYQKEIINDGLPSRTEMLDAIYDGNRNFRTEVIQQTYIVYYKKYNGKNHKFTSQASFMDVDSVKIHIHRNKGIDLYIDPKNPNCYYFDLPYL